MGKEFEEITTVEFDDSTIIAGSVYSGVESTATTLNLLSGLAINKHVTVGDFRQL